MKEIKKAKIYEETFVNNKGEMITKRNVASYTVPKEDDYIKLYYKTMLTFNGINTVFVEYLLSMCNYLVGYNDKKNRPLEFIANKSNVLKMSADLKKEEITIRKHIKKMVDCGILVKTENRGVYYCNPYIIAKGNWNNIINLRGHFDFRKGKWETDLEIKNSQNS